MSSTAYRLIKVIFNDDHGAQAFEIFSPNIRTTTHLTSGLISIGERMNGYPKLKDGVVDVIILHVLIYFELHALFISSKRMLQIWCFP